jgi:hypothetical protein
MLLRRAADNPVKVLLANPVLVCAGCREHGIWTNPGRILDFLSHSERASWSLGTPHSFGGSASRWAPVVW